MTDEPSEIEITGHTLPSEGWPVPRLTPEQAREARQMEFLFENDPRCVEDLIGEDPDYGF